MSEATLAGKHVAETIVETIDDVAFVVDEDLQFVYANEQSREYIDAGPTGESILTLTEPLFAGAGEHERFADALAAVVADDARESHTFPLELELEVEVAGNRRTEELQLSPIRDNGRTVGAVGIARDVTEHKQREAELRETERLLRRLYRISAQSRPFEDRLADILEFAREYMGVEQGFLTRIEDDTQHVVVGVGDNDQLQSGASAPFGESYCRHTVSADETPLTVLQASDEGWTGDPAYERFGLECYVGSEVTVGGDTYGTVCFADRTQAGGEFTETQRTFVELLTQWVSYELERRERERELRTKTRAIDEAPVGVTITDPGQEDNPMVYLNDAFEETTGYDAAESIGRNCRFLQGKDTDSEPVARMREAIDDREPVTVELRNYRKDGTEFWNQVSIAPVFDGNGELTNFVGFQREVSGRKERERELRETKQRLEAVLDTISAAVFMKDTDGRYLLMNRECRDLLDVGEDVDVTELTDEDLLSSEVAAKIQTDDKQVFERGETVEFEDEFPTDQGRQVHLTRKSPVYDDDGTVTGLCAVSTDITDQKQRERELEQFAYVASHDLREPLRVVSNYLQLLERRHGATLDEGAREYVEFAVDGAERMQRLIDGLLTYSRVDRRGGTFEPTPMEAVLEDARSNLEIAIEQSGATLSVPEEFPTVAGDRDQLVTVVQNLLDNAITYAGEEPPSIDVTVEERARVWVFTVADDGVGMDPDQADRAFELFERLTADADGTGLGLALCRKIIDRHGGTIWIDTAPGEGTAVHFTLPKPSVSSS